MQENKVRDKYMRILTILGTRPEIIRLSEIIPKLDKYCDNHILVHTGQNYDYELNEVFFKELGVRKPNFFLNATGTFAEQIGKILVELEKIAKITNPDKFLVLGDTNSSMGAIVMKRLGIPVYHMEAGNRCYNDDTPEEVNRRIIDCSSDILMPYTQGSKERLIKDGIPLNRIFVTGNPIFEVITNQTANIDRCHTLEGVFSVNDFIKKANEYFLVTLHRQENVDNPHYLSSFIETFYQLHRDTGLPVIVSTHPRLRKRIEEDTYDLEMEKGVYFKKPFGFHEFLFLQKHATCILTDSGTVMEESTILQKPCVILRESHERPECQDNGSVIIAGRRQHSILTAVKYVMDNDFEWTVPEEYIRPNVSDIVCKILLGV